MLLSICDFPWWLIWLLPLIGFILGWLLNGFIKNRRIADLEGELSSCVSAKTSLRGDYDGMSTSFDGLKGEHNLLSNRYDELSLNYKNDKATWSNSKITPSEKDTKVVKKTNPKVESVTTVAKSDPYSKLKSTNLQVVEGIGPKMDELLKKNGINNWKDLSGYNAKGLRTLLDNENPTRYKIIDPSTWAEQATYAANGKWNVLTEFQKNLDTGRTNTLGKTDAKVEKLMIRLGYLKKWKQDDLKAVEGIGPKIEGLFHAAGIKTWKALSEASVDSLKDILKVAGDRYRLADPGTWPEQARMANEGLWDKLNEYQDFLQGGK